MNVETLCLHQRDGKWWSLRSVATQTVLWFYVVYSGQRVGLECWWDFRLNCLFLDFLSCNRNNSLKWPCMCILFPELCCGDRLDQGSWAQIKRGAQLWCGCAVQGRLVLPPMGTKGWLLSQARKIGAGSEPQVEVCARIPVWHCHSALSFSYYCSYLHVWCLLWQILPACQDGW